MSFLKNIDKNKLLILVAIVAIVIVGGLILTNSDNGFSLTSLSEQSAQKIGEKAVNYINNNRLSSTEATLVRAFEENGLIKIVIKVGETEYDSYATKNGKLLFPQGFDMSDTEDKGNNNQTVESTEPVSFSITQDDNVLGNFEAPITLVVFSDFQCSFCKLLYPTLKKIEQDYKDKVRLVYKHFLLGFQYSEKAAEASECAAEQGKFWQYHDKLFDNSQNYSVDNFKKWARDLGLNGQQFDSCLDSAKYKDKIDNDSNEGRKAGVTGTPATFINGKLVSGAQPYESFKEIIDSLLSE